MSPGSSSRRLTGNLIFHAGGLAETVACKVSDGQGTRTLIARPERWQPDFEGDLGPSVLEIEALSGTRLKDGGDPLVFIRAWRRWTKHADRAGSVTFAAYFSRLRPGWLELGEGRPKQPAWQRMEIVKSDAGEPNLAPPVMPSVGNSAGEQTDGSLIDKSITARKRKGGRPRVSKAEALKREKLLKSWHQAKDAGTRQEDFCSDQNVRLAYLTKCINWAAQRRRRNIES